MSSWERLQDRLVRLLGNSREGRGPLVAGMLHRDPSEATSYWLQLVVSIGIATLGLSVGSSAVIIGAMLVAPLMGPIVGLAMGLATGSPLLVLRSAGRIGLSVLVAVGGAAAITLALPFHELNAEIAARASPTVLDLATAAFCALAGVYASLRPGSETAATAAGTSIGISLVPPLCASGFGLGTATWTVAFGAMLLFVTNLVAIVVVGSASFFAAGFGRVDVTALETSAFGEDPGLTLAGGLARRASRVFGSRLGPVLRFLMPVALLLAVYVPLRRALDEMAWQVRVRATIRDALAREPLRVVQTRVRVERRQVEVVLVLLGKTTDAEAARARIDLAIRNAAGVVPRVEVLAVPDAAAFAGLQSTLLTPPATPVVIAPGPTVHPLDAARSQVRAVLASLWPVAAAGAPLAIELEADVGTSLRIRVVHLGAPLSVDALGVLQNAAAVQLARPIELLDAAVPVAALTRGDGDPAFVALVATALARSQTTSVLSACVVRPEAAVTIADRDLAWALAPLLAAHPRVSSVAGEAWSVRFVVGPCPSAAPAGPGDGGADSPGDAAL